MGQGTVFSINKSDRDKKRLERLCAWIQTHLDSDINWIELTTHSGLNHMELQRLFMFHQKTSPMQWIKLQREQLARDAARTNAQQLMSAAALNSLATTTLAKH
jgi:transcriptional regulator GlxA family with amidase domain